jgi:hypothetical protein
MPLRALAAIAIAAALLAGCGSSSSSTPAKPAYCSHVAALKHSINALPNSATGGVSGLKTQLTTIQGEAQSVISSAKSDFPQETHALSTSLSALEKTVNGLSSGVSATEIATLTAQATAAVDAAKTLINATHSKCG